MLPDDELTLRKRFLYSPPDRKPLTRKVFAYYPYWAGDWRETRFDLLTSLSYFAIAMDRAGNIVDRNGYGTPTAQALIDEAKRWGIKTSVSVTNFSNSQIAEIVGSAAIRANAIENLVAEVRRGAVEGVSIDFESVPRSAKADFVTFMRELTTRMHAEFPGSEVSIAMPSVDWSGAYDYDQLVANADLLFIMCYGYHWSGGAPGPLAQKLTSTKWGEKSLKWTIDDYVRWGGPNVREKVILGLPWYGYNWSAASNAVPGARGSGGATAVFFRGMEPYIAAHGRLWDVESDTPYMMWQENGAWRQLWYDDGDSFSSKLDLVNAENLGGVGMWALGYERGTTEMWAAIDAKLVADGGVDGGAVVDAGAVVETDAGAVTDAGAEADSGAVVVADADAGAPSPPLQHPSASVTDGKTPPEGGCACALEGAMPTSSFVPIVAFLGLFLIRRRQTRA
ncbi:MAG: hypothetical protein HYY84_00495 [Deltaproteobacteria bacterium]|nr:hypothetical protein [Deltaproteobacteria bacterium]